mgnify:CR=1 FL=1
MKKALTKLLFITSTLVLASCGLDKTKEDSHNSDNQPSVVPTEIIGLSFSGASFDYDGNYHSIKIDGTLPSGVEVEYTNNYQKLPGNYVVTATFVMHTDLYIKPEPLTATMSIIQHEYDMSGVIFEDVTCEYQELFNDVAPYAIKGTLPEGVTVKYKYDSLKLYSIGTSQVTAVFTGDPLYAPIESMTCNVTVTKGHLDMSLFHMKDETITYDGKQHTIFPQFTEEEADKHIGLEDMVPNGYFTDVGVYEVRWHLVMTDNMYPAEDLTATLTIVKAKFVDVSLVDETFINDGKTHSLKIKGTLPEGMNVEYTNNEQSEDGTYKVTAHFTGENKNYILPDDLEANLNIVSGIVIDDKTVQLGEYPQSRVKDTELIAQLDDLSPESDGYIHYDGSKYLLEAAEKYGSFLNPYTSFDEGDVFYFKMEPITWKILGEDDNHKLVLSEKIIDNRMFLFNRGMGTIGKKTYESNNYEISELRGYLNGYDLPDEVSHEDYTGCGFIDKYFNDVERAIFKTTHLEQITKDEERNFAVDDRIYLLSTDELKNSEYGFTSNNDRKAAYTDYARFHGANGSYWNRSVKDSNSYCYVDITSSDGSISNSVYNYSTYGVRPAAHI